MGINAPIKPRAIKGETRKKLGKLLGEACGWGSYEDCEFIAERIVALALGGESASSIMFRLNPPVRVANDRAWEADGWLV